MTVLAAGTPLAWYVGDGEGAAYRAAGARTVRETGTLVTSRNAALDDAFAQGRWCVQLSDDLKGFQIAAGTRRADCFPVTLAQAIATVTEAVHRHDARLGGAAPTANPFYSRQRVSTASFVVGDFLVVVPSPERFDARLRLKEDYDFTCQHLRSYGRVARVDYLLAEFAHRSNTGGAVSYRTPGTEEEAIACLMSTWPGVFRRNPRREHEVLLRWGEVGQSGEALRAPGA